MAVSHVFSNAVPDATGTVTVWYGSTTASVAASDIVLPSHWNSAHNQVVTLTGNTDGVSSITGTNIVFGGSNNITLSGVQGANAGTINVVAAAPADGVNIIAAGTQTANTTGTVVFSNSNRVTFGMSNNSQITASIDAAGTGTTFAGTNASASITLNSNGLNLALSAAAGDGGPVYSYHEPVFMNSNNTQTLNGLFGSSSYVQPISCPQLSCSFIRVYVSMTTNTTSFATTINTTFSMSRVSTINCVLYSLNTGASSQSLVSVASGSAGITQQWSLQANSTGSQYTVSMNVSYPITGGTSSYSTSYATSQTRFDISSNSATLFTGIRNIDVPFATSLSQGPYWLAINASTNTGTQGTAAFSGAGFGINGFYCVGVGVTAGQLGLAGNATRDFFNPGRGRITSDGTTVSGFAISNASFNSTAFSPYVQFRMT